MFNSASNREQSYAGINYALQGGGRRSQSGAESAKPMVKSFSTKNSYCPLPSSPTLQTMNHEQEKQKMESKKSITRHKIQKTMSVWSFIFAVFFGIAGFCVPPLGIIDGSVLYLCAQFLLLTASLLGVSAMTSKEK